MAKKHSDEGNGAVMGGEYTCEEGKWQFAESHVGTLKIESDQGDVTVDRKSLVTGKETDANPNGWRFWSRRVMPVMQDGQTAEEYVRELERFDACDTVVIPRQLYVVNPTAKNPTSYYISTEVSGPIKKPYKLLVDQKGNPISGDKFLKLMIESALKLAIQRDLHQVLVDRATNELRSELGINEPVAGSRPTRAPRANAPAPEVDASEGLE